MAARFNFDLNSVDSFLDAAFQNIEEIKFDLNSESLDLSIGSATQQTSQTQSELDKLVQNMEKAAESQRKAEAIMRQQLGSLRSGGGLFSKYGFSM